MKNTRIITPLLPRIVVRISDRERIALSDARRLYREAKRYDVRDLGPGLVERVEEIKRLRRTPTSELILDGKEFSTAAERSLRQALRPFGIRLYADPRMRGSNAYGYLLSSAELSARQVRLLTADVGGGL